MGYRKIILAALLLQVAAAQQPQARSPGSIECRVTSISGQLLSKAIVMLLPSSPTLPTASPMLESQFQRIIVIHGMPR